MPKEKEVLIKSRERVRQFAEVNTPHWVVCKMCDFLGEESYKLETTFLDPACGDGNFPAEILTRKLTNAETPEQGLTALGSIYGVDIQADNVLECRARLLKLFCDKFSYVSLLTPIGVKAAEIVGRNIVHGDFLKLAETILNAETWDEVAEKAPSTIDAARIQVSDELPERREGSN